jgi:hypothetical protein
MRTLAAGVVAVLLIAQSWTPAEACSPARLLTSLPDTREGLASFGEAFAAADGAYLVTVDKGGKLEGGPWPMPCDVFASDSPPPPPVIGSSKAPKGERPAPKPTDPACTAGKTRVHVVETLKGARRADWIEASAPIQVIDGSPPEPVVRPGRPPAYGAQLSILSPSWSCGPPPFARRLSRQARYVVFTTDSGVRPGRITHAFMADAPAPYLKEARRLARPGR